MTSLLDLLIFDAVYGSWILSLLLFTLATIHSFYSLKMLITHQLSTNQIFQAQLVGTQRI